MTPKEQNKAKSTRLRYLAVLPAILIVLAGVSLVGKYGLPFGSQIGNYQRQAKTTHAQNKWAERIELPGLPNLHKVSDDLYRSAQPTAEGMQQLEKLGVKTVINLRSLHSDRDEIKDTGLTYEHIYMTTERRSLCTVSMGPTAQGQCAQFIASPCRAGARMKPSKR